MEPQSTYSLGQSIFFLTAVLVGPAFALGGVFLGAQRLNLVVRAAIPFFAVQATLATLAAIGLAMHPDYPVNGPPDRYVALLVIAAHLAGAAAVQLLTRADPEEDRVPGLIRGVAAAGWLFATLASVVIGMTAVMPPRLRLPDDAANVEERLEGHGFSSAHVYQLEADMSPESFRAYGERLGMPQTADDIYAHRDGRCQVRAFYDGRRMRFTSRCDEVDGQSSTKRPR